jgi:hypothetical protein
MFVPRLDILPAAQRNLWPMLGEVPPHFVLYGGTALALRIGHRVSVDFVFFSHEPFVPAELLKSLAMLKDAKLLQSVANTLTVVVNSVKVSFFGALTFGRVGEPDISSDKAVEIASLLDLAGTKAAVVTQRAESKDYIDLLALVDGGVSLPQAIGAAVALMGERYNPLLTLKALVYFGDGDLHTLSPAQKERLTSLAATDLKSIPQVSRLSPLLSIRSMN